MSASRSVLLRLAMEIEMQATLKGIKATKAVTTTVGEAIENAWGICESLRDELQSWFDNLPENFQSGSKGDELTEAIDGLNEFVDYIEEPDSAVRDLPVTYTPLTKKRASRRERRDEAEVMLVGALVEIQGWLDDADNDEHEARDDVSSFAETLEGWADVISGVDFPAMR